MRQATERLLSMAAFGDSKHADKIANDGKPARDKIYSRKTMDNYIDVAGRFVRWAHATHGCRMLEEAQQYVSEHLLLRLAEGKSQWTIRLEASALRKCYGCDMGSFPKGRDKEQKRIFEKIHKYAPVHEWRAEFARETYRRNARPLEEIPLKERYICRKNKAGIVYDVKAMKIASKELGHGRADVIALSYL